MIWYKFSLQNLTLGQFMQWIPELRHYAPTVPIVLVGTKLGISAKTIKIT